MHPQQPVGPRGVFGGAHLVSWDSDGDITVLGPDHQTRVWRRASAGSYLLVDGPPPAGGVW